jgi:excisionase family DNA binding protein
MALSKSSSLPPLARPPGSPWPLSEAANYLGISLRHLIRMADQNKVKTIYIGRRRLVPDDQVRAVAAEGTR